MQTAEQRRLLGAFVRGRREAMTPVGPQRRRRTPGLRREDLADLAGIGTTWLAWVEQGRDIRPSAAMLARLADALHLSGAERDYMVARADRRDPAAPVGPAGVQAPPAIAAAVEALTWPAYGLDPAWYVCCANGAARALFVGLFDAGDQPNLLDYVFTHPAARGLLPDWRARAARILSEFRHDFGRGVTDPRVHMVVDRLCETSAEFAVEWDRQAVLPHEGGARRFDHPALGAIEYEQHTLAEVERGDFRLVFLEPTSGGKCRKAP
jgi:transcriptional regulator with XRE-family HTH domain